MDFLRKLNKFITSSHVNTKYVNKKIINGFKQAFEDSPHTVASQIGGFTTVSVVGYNEAAKISQNNEILNYKIKNFNFKGLYNEETENIVSGLISKYALQEEIIIANTAPSFGPMFRETGLGIRGNLLKENKINFLQELSEKTKNGYKDSKLTVNYELGVFDKTQEFIFKKADDLLQ